MKNSIDKGVIFLLKLREKTCPYREADRPRTLGYRGLFSFLLGGAVWRQL